MEFSNQTTWVVLGIIENPQNSFQKVRRSYRNPRAIAQSFRAANVTARACIKIHAGVVQW